MPPSSPPAAFVFSVTYIGDLALATLSLDAVARRVGGPVDLVTSPQAAPLVGADSRLRRVWQVRSSKPLAWRAEIARCLYEARRRKALVVNLEVYLPRWRFVRRLCGLAGLEAWHLDLPGLAADNQRSARSEPTALPHRSHYYARAVGSIDVEPPLPHVIVDPRAEASVAARLASAGGGRSIVVVHPGSTEARRRAPVGLFAAILQGLSERAPILPVLVGSESEQELCAAIEAVLGTSPRPANWAGRLTLPELAALLKAADLFIGSDSGPLKIAEAVGARSLSLWGPTRFDFAGPRGPDHRAVRFDTPMAEAVSRGLELLAPRVS